MTKRLYETQLRNTQTPHRITIGVVLVTTLFCLGMIVQCNRNPEPIENTETKTVTTTRVDTVWKTKTVKVNRPIPVKETITRVEHDTLPVTQIIHSRGTVFASLEAPVLSSKYSGEQTLSDITKVSYVANVSGMSILTQSFYLRLVLMYRLTSSSLNSCKRPCLEHGCNLWLRTSFLTFSTPQLSLVAIS